MDSCGQRSTRSNEDPKSQKIFLSNKHIQDNGSARQTGALENHKIRGDGSHVKTKSHQTEETLTPEEAVMIQTDNDEMQSRLETTYQIQDRSSILSVQFLNARSIINKFDEFEATVLNLNPDIIGVTETWANENIFDAELDISGYVNFRKDRPADKRGGGVLLYVKAALEPVDFKPSTSFPEQVWCRIKGLHNEKLQVDVCYRTDNAKIFDVDNHQKHY